MSNEAVLKNKMSGAGNRSKIRNMAQIAMLSALSTVLMMIEFPMPIIAPPFYQMDFSEVPVLIGTFAMGPVAGILIELIKVLLYALMHGSATGGVGELANFAIGCSFIIPAGLFYRYRRNRKFAVAGMTTGTLSMVVIGCILNAFVLLPVYSVAFGMPVQAFIDMGSQIHSSIDNLTTFVILAVAPFNLMKGVIISLITFFLYKRIRVLLKGD